MKLIILFFISWFSFASYGVQINKISIKGNEIVKTELIRAQLQSKPKTNYSTYRVRQDVKKLYSLGFFETISVHSYKSNSGLHLVYKVKERPLVTDIIFKGNRQMTTEDLEEILTIKEFDFLNRDELYKNFKSMKDKYKENGYFAVNISYQLTPVKQKEKTKEQKRIKHDQVRLTITVEENQKLLIKKINFIGNRFLSAKTIKSYMATKEQNILSFIGKSGVYNKEDLERDLGLIDYLYKDRGFLSVSLEKPEVTFSPDNKGIYISITISEGPRFKVGEVAFESDKIVSEETFKKYMSLKEGDYFSVVKLQQDIQILKNLYKEESYVFAEATQQLYPDPSGAEVLHVLFKVNKGDSYKVDDVIIQGNYKTRDKVILRRLLLKEEDRYKESRKNLTQQSLQQLGFFDKVQLLPVPKSKGRVDLLVQLQEKENTGEANLGGGFNTYSRLSIQGGIKKNNFLGLGHSIALQATLNRFQEILYFSYTDPYFLDTDWTLGASIFNVGESISTNRQLNSINLNSQRTLSYTQTNTGFSFTFGRNLSNFANVSLKYQLQNQSIGQFSSQLFRKIPIIQPAVTAIFGQPLTQEEINRGTYLSFSDIYPFEEGEGLNSSLSAIIQYDKRNDRLQASKGYFGRLSLEYSGLGGDFHYTKATGNVRYYKPLFLGLILKNNFNFGMVLSNKKDSKVPFTELFLLGGPYNLRGFQQNTIGPRKYSQQAFEYATAQGLSNAQYFAERPYGGEQMFYYNLEIEVPILKAAQMNGAVFFDIGEVNKKLSFDVDEQLRLNVGAGIRWRSPFGPVSLDLGIPYKPRENYGENPVEFQFGIGSSF